MSPDEKIKTMQTVRGKDLKIRYTQDNLTEGLINQRQFYDAQGQILTPITSKLLERQVVGSNNPTIARLGVITPRIVKTCFGSIANASGESNFAVIIPYAPGDISHKEHLSEIFGFVSSSQNLNPPTPLTVNYQGENQT
jgi:hypothetical protein